MISTRITNHNQYSFHFQPSNTRIRDAGTNSKKRIQTPDLSRAESDSRSRSSPNKRPEQKIEVKEKEYDSQQTHFQISNNFPNLQITNYSSCPSSYQNPRINHPTPIPFLAIEFPYPPLKKNRQIPPLENAQSKPCRTSPSPRYPRQGKTDTYISLLTAAGGPHACSVKCVIEPF